jgi:anti-anti-sigma regulatory factor
MYDGRPRASQDQWSETVLKITTIRNSSESLRVHLCGQFTREYVPELEKALELETTKPTNVALDLSNVTFVDREAMVFLCSARSRNVAIENIPSYVTRWIEQENRCGSAHRENPDK